MPKEYGDRIKKVRPSLLEEGRERKYWDGPFNTADDVEGILMAGSPQDIINEVKKFIDYGTDHLVFDFRLRPDDYDEQVAWVARDVRPAVKELAAKAKA